MYDCTAICVTQDLEGSDSVEFKIESTNHLDLVVGALKAWDVYNGSGETEIAENEESYRKEYTYEFREVREDEETIVLFVAVTPYRGEGCFFIIRAYKED